MKKILLMIALVATLIAVGRIAGETAEAPRQTPAAELPAIQDRVVLVARNERELRFALVTAEKTPNVVISLVKGTVYVISSPVRVRGRGTVLMGNRAVIEQRFSHSGLPDPLTGEEMSGIAVLVGPRLGRPEPWSKEKEKDYIWMNEGGTVGTYAKAADAKEQVKYSEPAPVQYPGQLLARYTVARKILVPSERITVENLVIRCADANADIAMGVEYVKDGLVRGISTEGTWKTAACVDVVSCEGVTVDACAFSSVNLNSANFCRVTHCTGTLSMEEMVRWCDIDHNSLSCLRCNDVTCEANRILNNHFVGSHPNFGSIALPGASRFMIVGNLCDDLIWCGDVRGMVLQYNTAPHLDVYGPKNEVSQTGNSWQNPPDR